MRHQVLKRAAQLFLALAGMLVTIGGGFFWHHMRVADPCSSDGLLDGQPVTCDYRILPTGDWLSLAAVVVAGFSICFLVSWLSFKARRPR